MKPEANAPVTAVSAKAYRFPTAAKEADGTLEWSATTIIICEVDAGGMTGIGYTYTAASAAEVIRQVLTPQVLGKNVFDIPLLWWSMTRAIRNFGPAGIATMAVSAVDAALWDLKAKLLGLPLAMLIGKWRETVPVYASGGFTTLGPVEIGQYCEAQRKAGFTMVKIKVGRDKSLDLARVKAARSALGADAKLFIDANGAYDAATAAEMALRFCEAGDITWFEEPVTSEDLAGLRSLKYRTPASVAIAAGEYGHSLGNFQAMLAADAVDTLQVDATRAGGISGLLEAASLCRAYNIPLSCHTAPALHLSAATSIYNLVHLEYFYDHAILEAEFFDGIPEVQVGHLRPDLTRPGMGISLKYQNIKRFQV